MKTLSKIMLGLAVAAAIPLVASARTHDHSTPAATTKPAGTPAATPQSDGEIKKVDKDAGKITVKHGPLANLDMGPMTMLFRVKDPAMLEQVKAGDKVKMTVEKLNGALTITALQVAKQ